MDPSGCIAAGTGRLCGCDEVSSRSIRAGGKPSGVAGEVPKTRSEGRRELGDARWRTACVGRQGIPWMVKRPTATIGKGPVCARFALFHCAAETRKEMPDTLDEALKLAIQQESVEAAQKSYSSERGHGSSSLASSSIEDAAAENGIATMSVQQLGSGFRENCSGP